MGFKAQSTLITLEFAEPSLKGLEIRVRSANFGQLKEIIRLAATAGGDGVAALTALEQLTEKFVQHVMGWNLEHEAESSFLGESDWVATPISVEGLDLHATELVMEIVFAWVNSMTSVSESSDLGKASSSGSSSEEESIPMDVSSPSLTSFSGPSSPSTSVRDSELFRAL